MPHIYWIKNCAPKSCADCTDGGCRCPLDESMPCSPDCEELDPETGQPSMSEFCKTSCDAIFVRENNNGEIADSLFGFTDIKDMLDYLSGEAKQMLLEFVEKTA